MGKQNHGGGDAQRSSPSSVPDAPEGAVPPPPSTRPPAIRERLLRATTDVISTLGYEAARVEHVVEASGLSRTAFYRYFGGKRGAVLAAAGRVLDDLTSAVQAAQTDGGPDAPSAKQATATLTALTNVLAADPPAAAVLVLEAPAVGPAARKLRADLLALIDRALGDPPGLPAWSPAGAILDLLHRRIARGQTVDLPALVPALVHALDRPSLPPSGG